MGTKVLAHAPGRVNLIGDHTDYSGGWVLPMAIDLGTTIEFERDGPFVELLSADHAEPAVLELGGWPPPSEVQPPWARYVAGVVAVMQPPAGGRGFVRTDLPIGAGLSSSAALEVATALALGFVGPPLALARVCQQAEQLASGVPCGIMDQLASAAGVAGHALLIDCTTDQLEPVPLPDGASVVVVHSGQQRSLVSSAYGVRKAQVDEAAALAGPLRLAGLDDVEQIAHDDLRRRARHVVTENRRVTDAAAALRTGDLAAAGKLIDESHRSLRDDFQVSTPVLDELVERLRAVPGVHGARLTGAGFGGCCIVLAEAGTVIPEGLGVARWPVQAVAGATVEPVP